MSSATATYLSIANASATYLSTATASGIYLTTTTAGSTYLSLSSATATYLNIAGKAASSTNSDQLGGNIPAFYANRSDVAASTGTFLSLSSATATYLTIANASSSYLSTATASGVYLTTATAGSTYLSLSSATATYLTKSSATATYLQLAGGTMSGPITSSLSRLQISTNVYIVGYASATAFYGTFYGDGTNVTTSARNYGEMYSNNNAVATPISVAGTFYKMVNVTTSGLMNNFTHTTGRLAYSGTGPKTFHINISLDAQISTSNQIVGFQIYVNGAAIAKSNAICMINNIWDRQHLSLNSLVTLTTNDYVEMYVTNNTDHNSVTISDVNFIVETSE